MGVSFRMSGRTEVSSFSSIVFLIFLLSFTNANNDLFTDFISNVLVDNQFSDGFFSELLAAKYIFEHDQYNDVFGGITKRSTDSKVNKGLFPQKKSFYKESNFSTDFWRPLPAPAPVYKRDKLTLLNKDQYIAPAPVYVGAKGGNQTYKVVYSKQANTPQKFQKSPKFKKIRSECQKQGAPTKKELSTGSKYYHLRAKKTSQIVASISLRSIY